MKIVNNFYKIEKLRKQEVIKIIDVVNFIISAVGVLILNIQFFEINKSTIKSNYRLVIYNIIGCFVIFLINVYCVINKRKVALQMSDLKKLEEQNKNLLEVNDKVRSFRHDFNNIIQAIDGYIVLKDMNSLQKYFNSLVSECNYVNCIDSLNSQIKNNPAIYGILLEKYKKAQQFNINMNIEVSVNLIEINNKSYIISRILGILLDNALEASKCTEEKIINVQFLKQANLNRIDIVVENSYINKDVDTDKIFEKGYTTKSGNTGLGLWKVRDILRKDTNLDLFTSKDEKMFKQQFEIYI